MKKLNSYIPLWFLLLLSPAIVLTFCFNLLMSVIGLLIGTFFTDFITSFEVYRKNILKVIVIAFLNNFMFLLAYLLPELLYKIDFIKNNLITPLEYNPYKSIFATLYVIAAFTLISIFTFKKVYKFANKNLKGDEFTRKLAGTIIAIFILPYLFLIPSTYFLATNKSNLDDFRGTIVQNQASMQIVIESLNVSKSISSYTLVTKKEPYELHIYLKNEIKNRNKFLELDAATLYSLISNLDNIYFHIGETKYEYNINRIIDTFGNVREMNLIEIQNRYKQIPFTQFRYLGNVKGYDIFDTGKEDLKDIQIFEDKYGIYTIEATSKSNLIYYDGEEMSQMTYLMNDGKILISDFYPADIYIKVTGGENENNNK